MVDVGYSLYNQVCIIGRDRIKYTGGIKGHSINLDAINESVDEAKSILNLAGRYWESLSARSNSIEQERAARLLKLHNMDIYIFNRDNASRVADSLERQMLDLYSHYYKTTHHGWQPRTTEGHTSWGPQ